MNHTKGQVARNERWRARNPDKRQAQRDREKVKRRALVELGKRHAEELAKIMKGLASAKRGPAMDKDLRALLEKDLALDHVLQDGTRSDAMMALRYGVSRQRIKQIRKLVEVRLAAVKIGEGQNGSA